MACQGQIIALPCGVKNPDSVVPSATPNFLLEDVAILFGLMAENRNSCHEITPTRLCHLRCHSVQNLYLPLSYHSFNIKLVVHLLYFCSVFVFLFKGVTWIEELNTSVIRNFSHYEGIPIEGGVIFRV
jgi:hypothetical protein